jgi:hypothetical protein
MSDGHARQTYLVWLKGCTFNFQMPCSEAADLSMLSKGTSPGRTDGSGADVVDGCIRQAYG